MAVSTALTVFGKIIYEPVHLMCDVLNQPLKVLDGHLEKNRVKAEEQRKKEFMQFEQDLELDRQRREMELTEEQRQMEAELSQMILDKELARQNDMVQMEIKYREEMANAAARLAETIANMQVDVRGKVLDLYNEKKKEYLDTQMQYKKEMFDTVKEMRECEIDKETINGYVNDELKKLSQTSLEFSQFLVKDTERVFHLIDNSMNQINDLGNKYFQPALPDQPALTQEIIQTGVGLLNP